MSAIGLRGECGGLCARCRPSVPAPCFGENEPGLGDGDQRIIWVLIQPATRTDVTHWLPQVTSWQKKIKSRCVVKDIAKQEATSCWSEQLLFTSKPPLPPPFKGNLIFLSGTYPSLFSSVPIGCGMTTLPVPRQALIGLGQAAYSVSPGTGREERFLRLVGAWGKPSPFSLRRGMRVWSWTRLE